MEYGSLSVKKKLSIVGTSVAVLLIIGTLFYHFIEKWSWVDSFYFTGVTLTTIGYGDIIPTMALTKIVTVFFAFVGIGMVLLFFTIFAEVYIEHQEKNIASKMQKYTDELKKFRDINGKRLNDLRNNNLRKLRKRKHEIIKGTRF